MGSLLEMLAHKELVGLRVIGTGGIKRSPTLPDVPADGLIRCAALRSEKLVPIRSTGRSPSTRHRAPRPETGAIASAETKKRFEAMPAWLSRALAGAAQRTR
jgi:hypothetical protein